MKPVLEVEVVGTESTAICRPKGDLDAMTVTTFRGAIALCLGESGLIIDLSDVRFIDGAGLTALVGTVRRAESEGTRVAVVVPPGRVSRVLDGAGLDMIVSVFETVALALADIHNGEMTSPERIVEG